MSGRLGLLHVGKGQPAYPGGALAVGGLHMDDGDVRVDGRHQDQFIRVAPLAEGVVHDHQLAVWKARVRLAVRGGKSPDSRDVRSQRGSCGQKRNPHGPGHEAQGHLIVGVILNPNPAGLHRFAKTDAGGCKTTAAAVCDLEFVHTSRSDQFIDPLAIGMGV